MTQYEKIVNAIFGELSDRGGIGDQLSLIADDKEVYAEMHEACCKAVERIITTGEEGKWERQWSPGNK